MIERLQMMEIGLAQMDARAKRGSELVELVESGIQLGGEQR